MNKEILRLGYYSEELEESRVLVFGSDSCVFIKITDYKSDTTTGWNQVGYWFDIEKLKRISKEKEEEGWEVIWNEEFIKEISN